MPPHRCRLHLALACLLLGALGACSERPTTIGMVFPSASGAPAPEAPAPAIEAVLPPTGAPSPGVRALMPPPVPVVPAPEDAMNVPSVEALPTAGASPASSPAWMPQPGPTAESPATPPALPAPSPGLLAEGFARQCVLVPHANAEGQALRYLTEAPSLADCCAAW